MFDNISETISNAAKSTGAFLNANKGKVALGVAAIGVAYYYRDEISNTVNDLVTKVSEVPVGQITDVVTVDVVPSVS